MNSLNDLLAELESKKVRTIPGAMTCRFNDGLSAAIDLITTLSETHLVVSKDATADMVHHASISAGIAGILWEPEDYKRVYKAMLGAEVSNDE